MISSEKYNHLYESLQTAISLVKELKENRWEYIMSKLRSLGLEEVETWNDLEIALWYIDNYPNELE